MRSADRVVGFCAAVTALGGAGMLLAWALGLEWLTRILPDMVSMKPNTALGFVLSGTSLWLVREHCASRQQQWSVLAAVLVLLIGTLTFYQMLYGVNLGIDELLFRDIYQNNLTGQPGRMSPMSAVSFVLLALGLLSIQFGRVVPSEVCAVGVFLVGLLALIGYAYDIGAFYRVANYTAMSFPTALLFLVSSFGLLLARPQTGLSRLLISASPVGQQSRELLVIMCVITLFSGALIREMVGAYSNDFAFALFTLLMFVLVVSTILFFGSRLISAERIILEDREALVESESRYRSTFNNAFIGIAHVGLDGRWMEVNDTLSRMLGYSAEELARMTVESITHEGDVEAHRRLLQQMQAGEIDQYRVEKRYLTRSGELVWVDLQAAPMKSADGEPLFLIKSILDITQRKSLEERLRNLAAVVENTADFVCIYDLEFRPRYINPAGLAMLGFASLEEAQQHSGLRFFDPEDLPRVERDVLPALRERGRWTGEVRFRNLDSGVVTHSLWNVVTIRDPAGQPVGYSTVSPDLNELKATERKLRDTATELENSNREKDVFLSILGHELRNPLGALRNALAVLNEAPDERIAGEMRAIMSRQTSQIASLVDDLVDLARIQAGRMSVERKTSNLASVLRTAVRDRRLEAEQQGVRLTLAGDDQPVPVAFDRVRIRQVIHNLLTNAFRAAPGGKVEVELSRTADRAVITVRDDGNGIAGEDLERIFRPFEQQQDVTRRGLGLGLYIARELVVRHEGTLTAHSDGPGRGAVFTVCLPLSADVSVASVAPRRQTSSVARKLVLIDDCEGSVDGLVALLSLKGHEVHHAYAAREGIELVGEVQPEIVISDIGLPEMDGYAVARELRERWGDEQFLLVALTGFTDAETVTRAREAGFDLYLTKPVNIARLTAILADPERHKGSFAPG